MIVLVVFIYGNINACMHLYVGQFIPILVQTAPHMGRLDVLTLESALIVIHRNVTPCIHNIKIQIMKVTTLITI